MQFPSCFYLCLCGANVFESAALIEFISLILWKCSSGVSGSLLITITSIFLCLFSVRLSCSFLQLCLIILAYLPCFVPSCVLCRLVVLDDLHCVLFRIGDDSTLCMIFHCKKKVKRKAGASINSYLTPHFMSCKMLIL